jgi:hypothetical protein
MKLLLDDKGNVVVRNGKPVYVQDDGKELEFDADHALASIARLNKESKDHREGRETAETLVAAFKDIDPKAAREAIKTVANLSSGDLVKAGDVDKIKGEVEKAVRGEYAPIVAERDTFKGELYGERIGGSFARSALIVGDKATIALPADIVQAQFGKHFTIDDKTRQIVAKDAKGEIIYSRVKPGDVAGFDEALSIIVDQYPNKASILKGTGANGSGAGNVKQTADASKQIKRSDFFKLSAADQSAKSQTHEIIPD